MVHAENPAQGIEPQRANQRGAEEGVRRAFGFPGSRFLYRDVRISQARAMARSLPMAWSLHESGREPGRFYSSPVFASIPEVIQGRRARMKRLRMIGLPLAASFCAGQAYAEDLSGTLQQTKHTPLITTALADPSI